MLDEAPAGSATASLAAMLQLPVTQAESNHQHRDNARQDECEVRHSAYHAERLLDGSSSSRRRLSPSNIWLLIVPTGTPNRFAISGCV